MEPGSSSVASQRKRHCCFHASAVIVISMGFCGGFALGCCLWVEARGVGVGAGPGAGRAELGTPRLVAKLHWRRGACRYSSATAGSPNDVCAAGVVAA